MLPNRPLNECLPIRFPNGEQVRQFSKPCVHCGQMLNTRHMHGIARLFKDHIAIAAKAHCPDCGEVFAVTCLIDDGKRVQRVIIPYWLFNPYLRVIRPQPGEPFLAERLENPGPTFSAAAEEAPPASAQPIQLQRAEESVGRYQGKPIPAWVRVNGQLFMFERITQDKWVEPGEFLLDDCLLYRSGRENC